MEADNADINGSVWYGSRSATCSSPAPSCESMKSDWSMGVPICFKEGVTERSDSSGCLSLESDDNKSMDRPINYVLKSESSGVIVDHVRCFVCSDILRGPVTTPCGHNFCMCCIENRWSQPGPAGEYTCPQCAKVYPTRPELSVNDGLNALLNALLQGHCAGPACDICSSETRPAPAIKTCKTCNVSYCEKHVRRHYTVPKLKEHNLEPVN